MPVSVGPRNGPGGAPSKWPKSKPQTSEGGLLSLAVDPSRGGMCRRLEAPTRGACGSDEGCGGGRRRAVTRGPPTEGERGVGGAGTAV